MKRLFPCLLLYLAATPAAHADFRIFDGTGMDTLPVELYDEKVPIVYQNELFSATPIVWPKGESVFCEINVEQVQAKALQYIGAPRVILNVEGNGETNEDGSWKNPCLALYLLDGRVDQAAAIDRYLKILSTWKAANPDTRIGFYGIFSVRRAMQVALNERGFNWAWLQSKETYVDAQESRRRLTEAVDDLYPSAYWDGTFPSAYARGAEIMQETIESLHPNKSVYPFVWFRPSLDRPAHQALTFQFMLETMQTHADGVVLWAAKADTGLDPRARRVRYVIPEKNLTMAKQARQMRSRKWQIPYKESQWMYALRDFKADLD